MSAAEKLALPPAPRPFLKWAGGKRELLDKLRPHLPATDGTYWEPFVGGGAVFFDRLPAKAVLSDTNERLVRTYLGVRDEVEDVVGLLQEFKHSPRFFEQMRGRDIDRESNAEVAAWFIYLNRTGYNGLYRVNSRNVFNVPFGDYANPTICDAENLRACSRALQGIRIECRGFDIADDAQPGDVVYCDPPYIPLPLANSFRSYTAGGFRLNDQIRLRDLAARLMQRGCALG